MICKQESVVKFLNDKNVPVHRYYFLQLQLTQGRNRKIMRLGKNPDPHRGTKIGSGMRMSRPTTCEIYSRAICNSKGDSGGESARGGTTVSHATVPGSTMVALEW